MRQSRCTWRAGGSHRSASMPVLLPKSVGPGRRRTIGLDLSLGAMQAAAVACRALPVSLACGSRQGARPVQGLRPLALAQRGQRLQALGGELGSLGWAKPGGGSGGADACLQGCLAWLPCDWLLQSAAQQLRPAQAGGPTARRASAAIRSWLPDRTVARRPPRTGPVPAAVPADKSKDKTGIRREEEPDEYWTSQAERDGKSPFQDPLAQM